MLSFPTYTFSFSSKAASDDVLMIKPTMYFLMPKNKNQIVRNNSDRKKKIFCL